MIFIFKESRKLHIVAIVVFILFITFYVIQNVAIYEQSQSDTKSSESILITDGENIIQVDSKININTDTLYIKDFTTQISRVERGSSTIVTIYDMESLTNYLDTSAIDWKYTTNEEIADENLHK